VFFIREHATLVTGDVLSGVGGRLHVFVDEADPELLLPALDTLAELPIGCFGTAMASRRQASAPRSSAPW
jgi:hypothetical protein